MRKSGKMASHNELGKEGETAAVTYLMEKGYEIRHRNWHSGHRDLDIVAQKDGELVIVEVKTRSDACFGQPEDAVDRRKIRSITVVGSRPPFHIAHIEDAFFPPVWN